VVVRGWYSKYEKILHDFGFSKKEDLDSAKLLDAIIKNPASKTTLLNLIRGKVVVIFGAGPSLLDAVNVLAKRDDMIDKIRIIAADGATSALLEKNVVPDIVVTDLDGDRDSLIEASMRKSIMVVHAHGDNTELLEMAASFTKCIGTTQTRPIGNIHNFGGFTDGDRCVFLADHFKAVKIILLGMDFGTKIGRYSKKEIKDRQVKIKKLRWAKRLLEWLASKRDGKFYSTSRINGFKKIKLTDLHKIIISR